MIQWSGLSRWEFTGAVAAGVTVFFAGPFIAMLLLWVVSWGLTFLFTGLRDLIRFLGS